MHHNQGFDPQEIQNLRQQMTNVEKPYIIVESEDNSDEYMNFLFIGMHEGKEVIYDAALYTLRLHHSSELYELAEHKAARRFPEYRKIAYREDENGDIEPLGDLEEEIGLFMAEVMEELEEEESVKVNEHVDIDLYLDYGIGLDIGLNVEKVDDKVIRQFIKAYNEDTLELDTGLYTFQTGEDE